MKTLYLAVSCALLFSCAGYVPAKKASEAYYNLGNAYVELERHEDAVKAYSHALELNRELALARYNLARTYAIRQEYEKAIEAVDVLLEDDPDSLLFRELKAWIYYLSGDYYSSITAYEEVILIDPLRDSALFNLAVLYDGKDELEKALPYYMKLTEIYPDNIKYAFKLGDAYYRSDMYVEAIIAFSSIADKNIESKLARQYYYSYGNSLEKSLEYTEAIEIYKRGQALIDDNDASIFFFLEGRIQWNVFDDPEQAYSLFQDAQQKGFADHQEIRSFVEDPETVDRDELIVYFTENDLYIPDAEANDETSEDILNTDAEDDPDTQSMKEDGAVEISGTQ